MPVDKQVNLRLQIIADCLRKNKYGCSMKSLLSACNEELKYHDLQPVSEWSIRRDIARLQEHPYNVLLTESFNSFHEKVYGLEDPAQRIRGLDAPLLAEDSKLRRLIRLLDEGGDPQIEWLRSVASAADQRQVRSLDDVRFAVFQDAVPVPSIGPLFRRLSEAIMAKVSLRLFYRPFNGRTMLFIVHPYRLREYNGRWFLIASEYGYERLSVFPLDRIKVVKNSSVAYRNPSLDIDEYYADVVGVSRNASDRPVLVILQVTRSFFPYLATKPIHASQRELQKYASDSYRVLALRVIVNEELMAVLRSFGHEVRVAYPAFLQEEFVADLRKQLDFYQSFGKNCQE